MRRKERFKFRDFQRQKGDERCPWLGSGEGQCSCSCMAGASVQLQARSLHHLRRDPARARASALEREKNASQRCSCSPCMEGNNDAAGVKSPD